MLEQIELPLQYKVGHEKMDQQHARIFGCLLEMIKLAKNDSNKNNKQIEEASNEILRSLRSHALNHFAFEESLMAKLKYPEHDPHKDAHRQFLDGIVIILTNGKKGHKTKRLVMGELAIHVKNWYMSHVLIEDKKIVAFESEQNNSQKIL